MNRLKTFLAAALLCVASTAFASPWQGFTALALSPDGQSFATGGREGEILWWETSTGELLGRWTQPGGYPVVGLAFNSDSTRLGIVLLDGTLVQADSPNGELAPLPSTGSDWKNLALAKEQWITSGPLVKGLATASGDLWAKATPDGKITTGRQSNGVTLATWVAHEAAVTGLALASDGSFLLSCSYDGGLCRWDPATGRLLGALQSPLH